MDPHPEERNLLLAALGAADLAIIEPHLRDVALKLGQTLQGPGDRIDYVYFPTAGMISNVTLLTDGQGAETGVIGREGVSGSSVVGDEYACELQMVQAGGTAKRLPATNFMHAYNHSIAVRNLVNFHNVSMWRMAQQCLTCNSLHPLESRLARWLLQTRDRIGQDDLPLTQEFLSLMLAVQRSSVATAARPLKQAGLISIRRGHVHILDGEGLTQKACECYGLMKARCNL